MAMEFLTNEFLPWLITTIASMVIGFLVARIKHLKQRDSAIEAGLRVLLAKTIIDAYDLYHNQEKHLTVDRKREIDEAYEAYHNLGGNGTVTAIYEELKHSDIWVERR